MLIRNRPETAHPRITTAAWVCGYLAVYLVASGLDLWTTELALLRPGASEGNVFATTAGAYDPARAWPTTLVGGAILALMFGFGVRRADQVAPEWLRRPIQSFGRVYFRPWAPLARSRAPLHLVSYALAFVVLRLLAAGNNLLIAGGGRGPIGTTIQAVAERTTPLAGFMVVVGVLYLALTLLASPAAAALIARQQAPGRARSGS